MSADGPNALAIIADQLAETQCKVAVLSELAAALLAELAWSADHPEARLEEILGAEEGAVFSAIAATDLRRPSMDRVQAMTEAARLTIFDFARKALRRMTEVRRSAPPDAHPS